MGKRNSIGDSTGWFVLGAVVMGAGLVAMGGASIGAAFAMLFVALGICSLILASRLWRRGARGLGTSVVEQALIGIASVAFGLAWLGSASLPAWAGWLIGSFWVSCMLWSTARGRRRAHE